jgi:hypothetical protein
MNTDNIHRYLALTDQKKDLETQVKELNGEIEKLERLILTDFEKASINNVRCNGRTVYLVRKLWARPKDGDYETAAAALAACGLNDFLKQSFNLNSISAYVREMDANGETLPEPIARAFDVAEVFTIQSRKGA